MIVEFVVLRVIIESSEDFDDLVEDRLFPLFDHRTHPDEPFAQPKRNSKSSSY